MNKKKVFFLYAFFAILASLINLTAQRFVLSFGKSNFLFITAILIGTFLGLLVKFFLDKKWIFKYKIRGLRNQSFKFGIYSVMGIFTTIIFWFTETIFWKIWQTDNMREIGALIGLGFGYIIKYHLDKRFVFKK